jgi:hypothetical protein
MVFAKKIVLLPTKDILRGEDIVKCLNLALRIYHG